MTINDLEFFLVEVACDGHCQPIRSMLVRLSTDEGVSGWGETHVRWRSSELSARRESLLSSLEGRVVFDIEDLLELEVLSDPSLRSAMEMASWDLVGRATGQPLCHLFGGAYRRRIPVTVRLTETDPSSALQRAREMAEQGFHSQIAASEGQPDRDVELLSTVCEGAGDWVRLRFDAGAQYDTDTARDVCRQLEKVPLEFLLDPLDSNDLDQVASLRRQTSVPLALGRAISTPRDVVRVLRCGAAPNVVVDLQRLGGMTAARKAAVVAEAGGMGASLGGPPSLGIRTAAMVQLAASRPAFSNSNEFAYPQLHDDLFVESLEIIDGMIIVPLTPGLGVEVDRSKVEKYQVD